VRPSAANSPQGSAAHGLKIRSNSDETDGPKVVLVDVDDEGHHRSFINLYAQITAEKRQVIAVCPFPLEDIPAYLQPRVKHILFRRDLTTNSRSSILGAAKFWLSMRRVIKEIDDVGIVLFMYACQEIKYFPRILLDSIFPFPWAVLEMHPVLDERYNRFFYRVKSKLFGKKSISERYMSSKNLRFVAFLNETALEKYKEYYPSLTFAWLPDASRERKVLKLGRIAAEIRSAARGRKIVTFAGALDRRKGLYQMMYLAMNADASRYFFAFCGKPYWKSFYDSGRLFRAFQESSPENCYFHLDFISDLGDNNEFDSILSVSDVIFSAMQGYDHSSNLVTKAAQMRKPVIVTGTGTCGLRALKYRLGAVIPENDVACALRALERLAEKSHDGAWDEYARDFSVSRLSQSLLKLL
jgi:hypothetical protein